MNAHRPTLIAKTSMLSINSDQLCHRAGGPVNPNWQALHSSLQNGHRKRRKLEATKFPQKGLKGPEQLSNSSTVTQVLALDCEMVGVGPDGSRSALAR